MIAVIYDRATRIVTRIVVPGPGEIINPSHAAATETMLLLTLGTTPLAAALSLYGLRA